MLRLGAIANELSRSTERAFTMAQEWGLSEIELHTVWEKNIEMLNNGEVGRLKDLLHKHQLHLCCLSSTVFLRCHLDDRDEPIEWHTSFLSIDGRYAEHLHALERCLAIATELEAPMVRIFGFWRTGPTLEETFQEAAERIRPGIRMAEAAGIPLALENCPHTYFDWGTAIAIEAGILNNEEISKVLSQMKINVKQSGAPSIGLTVYPPYPEEVLGKNVSPPYHYQNGGDWTWFGGRMIQQLIANGFVEEAYTLAKPMFDRVLENNGFYEWYKMDGTPEGSANFKGSAGVLAKSIAMFQAWAQQHK